MKKEYNKQQLKSLIIYLISIGIMCFVFTFLVSVNIIGYSVKNKCRLVQEKYSGDCVEALMNYLEDEDNGFTSRNSAIWALGQLGDERTLPVLEKYYVGYNGERCNRSQELSQLELKRAIGYMQGSPNITTFFWRFGQGIN
ncbi:HEAT repeat domain-containing protein [Patescibacteria group bacterium]|nr:HEAT repeat domain-containing protein [Patescibacteria group bacterium]